MIPAWDLKTLYAANDEGGNSLTPIDPKTGKRAGPNIPVSDPYNMYFTPDGQYAIVVAEAEKQLTSPTRTPSQVKTRSRSTAPGSTTSTSRPTAATSSPPASSPASS